MKIYGLKGLGTSCCGLSTLLLLFVLPAQTNGAGILFYVSGLATEAHRSTLEPLAVSLVKRGHNVTFFSPLKPGRGDPRIINFQPEGLRAANEEYRAGFSRAAFRSRFNSKYRADTGRAHEMFDAGVALCEMTFRNDAFQQWVNRSSFDLLIIDKSSFSECAYALAYKFKGKVVSFSASAGVLPWDLGLYGVPAEASWIPSYEVFYESRDMGFFPRLFSELSAIVWYFAYLSIVPKYERVARNFLDVEGMPPLEEVIRSESLILVNSHYSDNYAKALPPFIVPVGGIHISESSRAALPNNTEKFIREGGDAGFIYINFGIGMSVAGMPEPLLKMFFEALGKMDLRFIWKWEEGKKPVDVPKNVLFRNRIRQIDVLAHSKIRGFITTGDQASMQEAIFHGVPVIIFPVSGDEDYNAKRLRRMGNGLELEFFQLTADKLTEAIESLVFNSSYKNSAIIQAHASKSRPEPPLDTATWWIEFVLKHDAEVLKLLKPLSGAQPWWMTRSLDVWGFLLIITAGSLSTVIFTGLKVYRFLRKTTESNQKSKSA